MHYIYFPGLTKSQDNGKSQDNNREIIGVWAAASARPVTILLARQRRRAYCRTVQLIM